VVTRALRTPKKIVATPARANLRSAVVKTPAAKPSVRKVESEEVQPIAKKSVVKVQASPSPIKKSNLVNAPVASPVKRELPRRNKLPAPLPERKSTRNLVAKLPAPVKKDDPKPKPAVKTVSRAGSRSVPPKALTKIH